MGQSTYQIQTALDAFLVGQTFMSGVTKIPENDATFANWAMQPSIQGKLAVRMTLVPATTTVETLGVGGFIKPNGFYAIDVAMPAGNTYAPAKQLADQIMGAFTPGLILTMGDGNKLIIDSSSPSPNLNAGQAKQMGSKIYIVQVIVKYFAYVVP